MIKGMNVGGEGRVRISDFLNYQGYDHQEELYILKDGSLGFVLGYLPVVYLSPTKVKLLADVYNIDIVKKNDVMQAIGLSSGFIDPYLERYIDMKTTDDPVLQKITIDTVTFFQDAAREGFDKNKDNKARAYRALVCYKTGSESLINEANNDLTAYDRIIEIRERISEIYKNAGIFTYNVDEFMLSMIVREYLGGTEFRKVNIDSEGAIRGDLAEEMLDGEYWLYSAIDDNTIEMPANNVAQVFTVKTIPDEVSIDDIPLIMRDLQSGNEAIPQLPQKYMIVATTLMSNRQEKLAQIEKDLFKKDRTKGLKGVGEKISILEDQYETMRTQNVSKHDTIVTVIVYSNDKVEKSSQVGATVESRFSSYGYSLQKEKMLTFDLFYFSFPLSLPYVDKTWVYFKRSRDLFNTVISAISPYYGDWNGNTDKPVLLFNGRSGQIIGFDIFKSNTSPSGVIIAPMGSGKSVMANYFISNYRAVGAKVWTVDVGDSYEKTVEVLGGKYYKIGTDKNLTLNPFRGITWKEYNGLDDEVGLSFAKFQIFNFFKFLVSPNELLDPGMSGLVEEAIDTVVEEAVEKDVNNISYITIEDIQNEFKNIDEEHNTDLANRLIQFKKGKSYGAFFENGPEKYPFKFDNMLNGIEIVPMEKGGELLMTAIMLSIIGQVANYIYDPANMAEMKLLFLDEWRNYKDNPYLIPLIERMIRQIRKKYGALFLITQAFEDMYSNAPGITVKLDSMMAYKFVLNPSKEELQRLQGQQKTFFNEGIFTIAETVHTVKGKFSESLLISEDGGVTVIRLVLPYFQRMLFTTDPVDLNIIKKYKNKGHSDIEAIEMATKEKYQYA
ncbi:MAG: TraC family protein [Brevinematales bacterium]|nr:TraC family protein [Brevinematales bacterium]